MDRGSHATKVCEPSNVTFLKETSVLLVILKYVDGTQLEQKIEKHQNTNIYIKKKSCVQKVSKAHLAVPKGCNAMLWGRWVEFWMHSSVKELWEPDKSLHFSGLEFYVL